MALTWTISIEVKDVSSQRVSITGTRDEDGNVSIHWVLDIVLPAGNKATKQEYMESLLKEVYLADKSKSDAISSLKSTIETDMASNMATWEGTL